MLQLGLKDEFIEHGDPAAKLQVAGLDAGCRHPGSHCTPFGGCWRSGGARGIVRFAPVLLTDSCIQSVSAHFEGKPRMGVGGRFYNVGDS